MGDIADDTVDGACCDLCGMYFENPENPDHLASHGYPATCDECWRELSKRDRKQHQKALYELL